MDFDFSKLDNTRPEIELPTGELEARINESKQSLAGEPSAKRGRKPKSEAMPGAELAASLGPVVATLIRLPFDIAADRTGCEGVRLSSAEEKGLTDSGDKALREALKKWAPQVEGAEVAITMFFLSMGLVAASKYMVLRREIVERLNQATNPVPQS